MSERPETAERPIQKRAGIHEHVEALRLLLYSSEDGREIETIWNSRDGVAPFVVVSRDNSRELRHVLWGGDPYAPHHVPNVGDRIIVSIDQANAERIARETARRLWNDSRSGYQGQFESEEHAFAMIHAELSKPGSPTLVTVTLEVQQVLLQKRSEAAQLHQRRRLDAMQGIGPIPPTPSAPQVQLAESSGPG